MTALLHAHSGLRFFILLVALLNVVVLTLGLFRNKPFGRPHRALGAVFVGCMHLQVLLGIATVMMGMYYPALIGHIVMMSVATVVAQVCMTFNRRKPVPGLMLPLVGVLGAVALMFGGVMAIGRGLLTMTVAS